MTSTLQQQLDVLVPQMRAAGTDLQHVEVKDASGGFPSKVLRSVSAFANGGGGLVILGLSEPDFVPTGIDASRLAATLASKCSDNLVPPIRPEIELCTVDGEFVVVAAVDELGSAVKPCLVEGAGSEAYVRSHDGNRRLTAYEHHALLASKSQPTDDEQPVAGTAMDDLEPSIVAQLLNRIRDMRGPAFRDADDAECLRLLGVLTDTSEGRAVTLAGLLALGRYPQQYLPRLSLTFVSFATETGVPLADGTRYLDSQPIEGSIPVMLEQAADVLRRNMSRRAVVVGLGREDYWDYPLEAVREVVVNALMHRDCHSTALGQPAMMALYPDRLEVTSPGGLYGAFDPDRLMTEPVTAARNARLAKLLQDVAPPGSGRTVCENVGTGLLSAAQHLRAAGLAPPEIEHTLSDFKVVFRNHTVLDESALEWLSTLADADLSGRQRLGLAHVRRHQQIDNRGYRALTGCDAASATRELTDLGRRGLLEKTGGRRWAEWRLADGLRDQTGVGTDSDPLRSSSLTRPGEQLALPAGAVAERVQNGKEELLASESQSVALNTSSSGLSKRQKQVWDLLADGPASSAHIADCLGVTRGAVLNWLRALEQRGMARTTHPGRRSPNQMWERTATQPFTEA